MKIAFVVLPFVETAHPPAELGLLAGMARQYGHEASVLDVNVELWAERCKAGDGVYWNEPWRKFWVSGALADSFARRHEARLARAAEQVAAAQPRLTCLWTTASNLFLSLRFARLLKRIRPEARTLLVNRHFFLSATLAEDHDRIAEFFRRAGVVDGVLYGPAYDEFARLLTQEGRLSSGTGVHCREGDKVVLGSAPKPLRNFDSLPFADFSLFPMAAYGDPQGIPLVASDGCPCDACRSAGLGQEYLMASGARLFLEASYHRRVFPRHTRTLFPMEGGAGFAAALKQYAGLMAEHRRGDENGASTWEVRSSVDVPGFTDREWPEWRLDSLYLRTMSPFDYDDRLVDDDMRTSAEDFLNHQRRATGLALEDSAFAAMFSMRERYWGQARPMAALRFYADLPAETRGARFLKAYFHATAWDIRRLLSMAARVRSAERVLETIPAGSRLKIWKSSPTFTDESDHGTCYRHRRGTELHRDQPVQRAERLLVVALSRASQVKLARARLDHSAESDRFLIRWGHETMPPEGFQALCEEFLRAGEAPQPALALKETA